MDRKLRQVTKPRQAVTTIAVVTLTITIASGAAMTVADHKSFPSVGLGLWWAIQTVTTVGYGDYVPGDVAGRLLGAFVMLGGIGFITVITAAITSSFVGRARDERAAGKDAPPSAETMTEIAERLARIEAALAERP